MSEEEPLFFDIAPDAKPIEMESLCMNCGKNGMTTMLFTKIPFFRELIVSRFACEECGYSDRRVQFAGEYPAKGVHFELTVSAPEDLNRRVVKSCHGVVRIPELDFEIPGMTQPDIISTVEGVISQAYEKLKEAEQTPALMEFLENLNQCKKGLIQFTFVLDDPSGNSFIENPSAPDRDPLLKISFYRRTKEQTESIGLVAGLSPTIEVDEKSEERMESVFSTDPRVNVFPTQCPVCSQEGESKSCTLAIPHFKEIILMAFNCQNCSYHSAEVMVGGDVSPCARRVTLKCRSIKDLEREVIKADTAAVSIPECDLSMAPGTLGGRFTTVEGLVQDIRENLVQNNPFVKGDSTVEDNQKFTTLIQKLESYQKGEPFTMILDDPLSNSYIQEFPDEHAMVIEDYERTEEQKEFLGLNDMKTEPIMTEHGIEYVSPGTSQLPQ